jgi:hypothetical protein
MLYEKLLMGVSTAMLQKRHLNNVLVGGIIFPAKTVLKIRMQYEDVI